MLDALQAPLRDILDREPDSVRTRLQKACELLQSRVPYYDWVGFYFRNGQKEELLLGPYAGDPTDHSVIPFGKGICGQVAVSNANFVVPDVAAQDNYIACSIHVKAEIVIPVFLEGRNIGQIDIDSHSADPFTEADETFLQDFCEAVSQLLIKVGITDPASELD